jgi:hypothetical protein
MCADTLFGCLWVTRSDQVANDAVAAVWRSPAAMNVGICILLEEKCSSKMLVCNGLPRLRASSRSRIAGADVEMFALCVLVEPLRLPPSSPIGAVL